MLLYLSPTGGFRQALVSKAEKRPWEGKAEGALRPVHDGSATVRQVVAIMSHWPPFNFPPEGSMTLAAHLAELSEKHRLLEMKIQEALAHPGADDLEITRLKLEKLKLKDEMAKLQKQTRH
jgi:hypothetical protein